MRIFGILMKRKQAVTSLVNVSISRRTHRCWLWPPYQKIMYPIIDPVVNADPGPILFGILAIPGNIACNMVLD